MPPVGVKFCMMVYICAGRASSLLDAILLKAPKSEIFGLNFGHLTSNILKKVSRSVICQLELTSARRDLSQNVRHGIVTEMQINHLAALGELTALHRPLS